MGYAVLQKNLDPPSLEQLKAAYGGVPGLTRYDAAMAARDAFGILGKGYQLEMAAALQHSLAAQGIEAEVVDETSLPQLPETFYLASLECTPAALLLHDSLGRVAELDWRNILLIAAGVVPLSEFKEVRTETKHWLGGGGLLSQRRGLGREARSWMVEEGLMETPIIDPIGAYTSVQTQIKEEQHERLLLEIVLVGGTIRYSLNSGKSALLFACLGNRRTNDLLQNFALLVQDLTHSAGQAAINRGAYYLRQNDLSFSYPGKTAFFHEVVWLLWKKSLDQPSA